MLVTSISEDDIEHIVASPMALVGSDGNCVAPYGQVGKGMPHPRFYGTFPRILHHYVRERGALPLPLAIHKMTGATARALKLSDRGLLKAGYRADVAIADGNAVRWDSTNLFAVGGTVAANLKIGMAIGAYTTNSATIRALHVPGLNL